MSLYINEDTNEYPRYQGDVELNPNGNWAIVEETLPQDNPADGMMWVEDVPKLEKSGWVRTWKTVPIPIRTKEMEIERAKMLGVDLQLLGVI